MFNLPTSQKFLILSITALICIRNILHFKTQNIHSRPVLLVALLRNLLYIHKKICLNFRIKRQSFCRSLPDDCYYGFYIYDYEADLQDYYGDEVVIDEEAEWEYICRQARKYCVAVKPDNYEVKVSIL